MSEVFSGPWTIRVLDSHFPQRQRFEISGSDSSDGAYPATPESTLAVTGQDWRLTMSARTGGTWHPSALRRKAAAYTNADGLVVTVGADDSPPGTAELDFDDLILVIHSEDPTAGPTGGWTNPYRFAVAPGVIGD